MWSNVDPKIIEKRIELVEKYKLEKKLISQKEFCQKNEIGLTQLRDWQNLYNRRVKKFIPVKQKAVTIKPEKITHNQSQEQCILEYGVVKIRFFSEGSLSRIPEIIAGMRSHIV